jgi:glutathione S-transferase
VLHLYPSPSSRDMHKVHNLLSLLDVRHQTVTVRRSSAEQCQGPVLVDGELSVSGSCAILVYLGRKYGRGRWLPVDAGGEALVQQWLSSSSKEMTCELLARYDQHLERRVYLVGKRPTIADISSYTDIRLAPGGRVDPLGCRSVRDWLARVEQLPGFVSIEHAS